MDARPLCQLLTESKVPQITKQARQLEQLTVIK